MILASSPSPSRRTTVPVPYLGCSTVMPARRALRTARAEQPVGIGLRRPRKRRRRRLRRSLAADSAARLLGGVERHAALAEELRDILHRVVSLAGEGVALGRLANVVALAHQIRLRPARPAGPRSTIRCCRHFAQEPGRRRPLLLAAAEPPPVSRPREDQPLARARHAHVAQPPLLFQRRFANSSSGCAGTAPVPCPTGITTGNSSPLALCSVIRVTGALLVERVGIRHQRGVIQKIGDRFAALGRFGRGVDQFVQVLQARLPIPASSPLQHLPVAGAVQNEAQQVRQRRANWPPATVPESDCGTSPATIATAWTAFWSSMMRSMASHRLKPCSRA